MIPGIVNTHTRLFQTLLKRFIGDMVPRKWFTSIRRSSAVGLTEPDVYATALHGCVESIRAGVTTRVGTGRKEPRLWRSATF